MVPGEVVGSLETHADSAPGSHLGGAQLPGTGSIHMPAGQQRAQNSTHQTLRRYFNMVSLGPSGRRWPAPLRGWAVLGRVPHLEAQDDGPDEAEGQPVVPIHDVVGPHVFKMDSLLLQELQSLVHVLQAVDAHPALRGFWLERGERTGVRDYPLSQRAADVPEPHTPIHTALSPEPKTLKATHAHMANSIHPKVRNVHLQGW